MSSNESPPRARRGLWHRLTRGKTPVQMALLQAAALITAVTTLVATAGTVMRWVDERQGPGTADVGNPKDPAVVVGGTPAADAFVTTLMAASGSRPIELNVQLTDKHGKDGDLRLYYACDGSKVITEGPCSMTRLQQPGDLPQLLNPHGWWLKGCYVVTHSGNGYGAGFLDIQLDWGSDTCTPAP